MERCASRFLKTPIGVPVKLDAWNGGTNSGGDGKPK